MGGPEKVPGHAWRAFHGRRRNASASNRPSFSPRAAQRDILSVMTEVRILSIIPPMTQLNTPYPSTAYLTGFLRSRGFKAEQADLSIALALKMLSVQGVQAIHAQVSALPRKQRTAATRYFADHFES